MTFPSSASARQSAIPITMNSTPAKPSQPLLTVCMIVRDEAENIAEVLASVLAVADEVVVVDTGSEDQTPAIAAAMGARVLHFAWTHDFSEARNVALAAARGKWILNIDADQRLNSAGIPALESALARTDCLAQTVTLRQHADLSAQGADTQAGTAPLSEIKCLRLIRNDENIRYRGRVHEDVAESLLDAGSSFWPDSGILIDDLSYIDADERARKRARNLPLLRAACADEPDAVYPAYKLALTLLKDDAQEGRSQLEETLRRLRRLPQAQQRSLPFLPNLISKIVASWSAQGRLVDAAQLCREFQPVLGSAIAFTAGAAMARAGYWEEARKQLQSLLDGQSHGLSPLFEAEPDAHPARACVYLAWIERMNGNLDEAARWIEQGNAVAAPYQRFELIFEAMEIQLLCGALPAVSENLDTLSAAARRDASIFPKLMYLSARLAHCTGDMNTALELARIGQSHGDDLSAALLARLEIETGVTDAGRLRQLYDAISGCELDTLEVKLLIGRHLGIDWPYAVPEQCAAH